MEGVILSKEHVLVVPKSGQPPVLELYRKIQRRRAKIVSANGRAENLPASLHDFLSKLNAGLGEGQLVAVVQNDAQLTTVEAARMLGVSRQFLVTRLDRNEMPFHMVGTHRRIYVRDLLAYKAKRDRNRRQVLDELTRAESEDGLYDLVPADGGAE